MNDANPTPGELDAKAGRVTNEFARKLSVFVYRRVVSSAADLDRATGWCLVFTGSVFALFVSNLPNIERFVSIEAIKDCLLALALSAAVGVVARVVFHILSGRLKDMEELSAEMSEAMLRYADAIKELQDQAKNIGHELTLKSPFGRMVAAFRFFWQPDPRPEIKRFVEKLDHDPDADWKNLGSVAIVHALICFAEYLGVLVALFLLLAGMK